MLLFFPPGGIPVRFRKCTAWSLFSHGYASVALPWVKPWGHHFPSPVVFRLAFPVCLWAASSPRLTLFCFFERLILPALELHINGITQYVILCISFFFIQHSLLDSSRLFVLFCCCMVFLLKCHNRFVYLLGYLV